MHNNEDTSGAEQKQEKMVAQIGEQLGIPDLKLVSQEEFLKTLDDGEDEKVVVDTADGSITRITNDEVLDILKSNQTKQ
jgi:hypothetical protein